MENPKKIAILTGATGGLGYAFLKELINEPVDEIWALGRNAERLKALTEEFGSRVIPFKIDLTDAEALASFGRTIEEHAPHIHMLINNAGIAQMKPSSKLTFEEINATIDLNCKAPAILTNMCLPFMGKGDRILNISSASAFQPVPYLNLYASTKAYSRSYTRALNAELKPLGVTATAVCPYWIDTDLLIKVINGKKVDFKGMLTPEKVAKKAMKDAKKGRDMSVCGFHVKCLHANVKFMPQKLTMKIWLKIIKKYM